MEETNRDLSLVQGDETDEMAAGASSPDLLNMMVPRPFGFNTKTESGASIIFIK